MLVVCCLFVAACCLMFVVVVYLIASRIPPGQGKELFGKVVNLSMGWCVDGLMGSLGGLGSPLGEQKRAKGSEKEHLGGQNRATVL